MLDYKDIINTKKNKACIILGHGTSLNPHLNRLQEYRDKGITLISCNNWYDFYDIEPEFWVLASSEMRIDRLDAKINKYKNTIVVYGDSIDLTNRDWITNNIHTDYLPYDQRHHGGAKCGCGECCNNIIPNRLTIQEEVQKYCGVKTFCNNSDTVAVEMLYVGLLLGCSTIYTCGLDIDYSKGFANNKHGLRPIPGYYFERERILETFSWANECAKNIGTRIINLNDKSSYNTFEIGTIP
jgi:hypothetical protein